MRCLRILSGLACIAIFLAICADSQDKSPDRSGKSNDKEGKLKSLLESNINAEWEAFKKKDKKAYSDLLAEDFSAVEDDNQGMRTKAAAVAEVDRSVVNDYKLFAITVIPLNPNSALVTYELTLLFPPGAAVRFKRVMVSEVWIRHNEKWQERYYQETHVR